MDTQSQPNEDKQRQDDAQNLKAAAESVIRGYWQSLHVAAQVRAIHQRLGQAALRRVKHSLVATALETDAPELLKRLSVVLRPIMLELTPDWVARSIGKVEVCHVDVLELIIDGSIREPRRRKMPPRTPDAMPCEAEFYCAIGSATEIRLKGSDQYFIEYIDGPTAGRVVSVEHEGGQYSLVIPSADTDVFVEVDLRPAQGDKK